MELVLSLNFGRYTERSDVAKAIRVAAEKAAMQVERGEVPGVDEQRTFPAELADATFYRAE